MRLSRRDAAIIGAFTGVVMGPFEDIQFYADSIMGRPTWTHEFGSKNFWEELKEKARDDFLRLCADKDTEPIPPNFS